MATAEVQRAPKPPGFRATDIADALQQRAAWLDALGERCLLQGMGEDGDPDSSDEDEDEYQQNEAAAPNATEDTETSDQKASSTDHPQIDVAPLCFAESQKRFAAARFEEDEDSDEEEMDDEQDTVKLVLHTPSGTAPVMGLRSDRTSVALSRSSNRSSFAPRRSTLRRLEPPARRLQRVRGEVETLCAWAETRKRMQGDVIDEVDRLGREVGAVAKLVQKAVTEHQASLPPEVASKRIWMPPQPKDDIAMATNLVELARMSSTSQVATSAESGSASSGVSYRFSAAIGQRGGWLGAAEGEVLQELEGRIHQLTSSIGRPATSSSSSAGKEQDVESLAGKTCRLHQRLDALQRVQDSSSCEQLLTTVRLLSTEVEVAIAEAKHLEALATEDPDDEVAEDELPQQVEWLHREVSGLSGILSRIEEIDRQLTEQEPLRQQLASFASDLEGAEAQAQHAENLLRAAAQTAQQMRESSEQAKIQLQKNVATLERRFATWEAASAATAAPAAGRRGEW